MVSTNLRPRRRHRYRVDRPWALAKLPIRPGRFPRRRPRPLAICCLSSPSPATSRVMEQPLPATEITALLGRGTRFEGKLHFEGRVRIDGVFKGEIKSDDVLIIGDGAEVH